MSAGRPVPAELFALGYREKVGRVARSCSKCRYCDIRHKCVRLPGHASVKRFGTCRFWEQAVPPRVGDPRATS